MKSTAAQLIADMRVDAGMTPSGMSTRAGLARSTLARVERGEADITLGTLRRAAAAAGFKIEITRSRIPMLAVIGDDAGDEWADWTTLRVATDWISRHPDDAELVCSSTPTTKNARARNLLAALAEKIASTYGFDSPAWATATAPLTEPWHSATWRKQSPPPEFVARGIMFEPYGAWRDWPT